MKKIIKLFLVGIFLMLPPTHLFAGGTETFGGGTLLRRTPQEKPILLDFVQVNPNFEDSHELSHQTPLEITKFGQTMGFEAIELNQLAVYPLVLERLNAWRENSPIVIQYIEDALNAGNWSYTIHRIGLLPDTYVSPSVKEQFPQFQLESAVLYTAELGAWISAPTWNNLGDYTKAGIIIHECLRHIQKIYGAISSEEKIQKITATIMLSNPSANFTLETNEFLDGELRERAVQRRNYIQKQKLLEGMLCKELEPNRQLFVDYIEQYRAHDPNLYDPNYGKNWVEIIDASCNGTLVQQFSAEELLNYSRAMVKLRFKIDRATPNGEHLWIVLDNIWPIHKKLCEYVISSALESLSMRNHEYQDVTRALEPSRMFGKIGLDALKEYTDEAGIESFGKDTGRYLLKILSLNFYDPDPARPSIKKIIRILKNYNEQLLKQEALFPVQKEEK